MTGIKIHFRDPAVFVALAFCGAYVAIAQYASAGEPAAAEQQTIDFADGKLQLIAPSKWVRKEPLTSIVEHEFSVPAVQGDERPGRVTLMLAGGTVEANIDRWKGQFTAAGDKNPAKVTKKQITGLDVHVVDLSGTFKDQRGPYAPAVERPNYRMLAAIIVKDGRNYFVKFYGPQRTVADNEKSFEKMIDGLKQK